MAAYFKLINKETKHETHLFDVDKEICEHLGLPFNEKKWCGMMKEPVEGIDWYNIIGLCLACGNTYAELRDKIGDKYTESGKELHDNMLKVIDYLEAHYDVDCGRC